MIYWEEMTYDRKGKERRALGSFNEKIGTYSYIHQDGEISGRNPYLAPLGFLRSLLLLPPSMGFQPVILINTEVEFLTKPLRKDS